MNYHEIRKFDMLNGEGCRVVLFVSGCNHKCEGCHNPQTWNKRSGKEFGLDAFNELKDALNKDYIAGLTLSGGDPLHENNIDMVLNIVQMVRNEFPNKNIWLYTGYTYDELFNSDDKLDTEEKIRMTLRREILSYCDVLVDGKFEKDKLDANYPWAGSTNQKVIKLH